MACCGSSCNVSSATFISTECYKYTVDFGSNEIDIRSFGSGDWGDFIACNKTGAVVVESYLRPSVSINEDVTFVANVCGETINAPCVVTGQSVSVDAKDVISWTTNLKITGAATIG